MFKVIIVEIQLMYQCVINRMTKCKHLTTRYNSPLWQKGAASTLYKFIYIVHHPIRLNICRQEIVGNIRNHLVTMPNLVPLSSQILWVECHAFLGNRVGYVLQLESVSRCLETGIQSYLCNCTTNFIEIPNISITCGLPLWWFLNLLAYRCMDPTILIVIGY